MGITFHERSGREGKKNYIQSTYLIWCFSKLFLENITHLIIRGNWTLIQHRLPHYLHILLRDQVFLEIKEKNKRNVDLN